MKPIILISVFVLVIYIGFYLNEKYNTNFRENGIETQAKITDITYGNSWVDLDGDDNILNPIIEYSFVVNNKTINSFYEINKEEYHLYFEQEVSIKAHSEFSLFLLIDI